MAKGIAFKPVLSGAGGAPLDGTNTWTGVNTFDAQVQWSKGADVASATVLPILTDGNYFDVTGTAAITSIATTGHVGTVVRLHFDGILTLTHSATDLVLPGAANITTAAGDEATFVEYASGDYRCTVYTKADGTAVVAAAGGTNGWSLLSTVTASASATVDFDNLIDSTFDIYAITIDSYRPTTTSTNLLCRIGTGATPTYQTGTSYQYHSVGILASSSAYAASNSTNDTSFQLNGPTVIVSNGNFRGGWTCFLRTGSRPDMSWQGISFNVAGTTVHNVGGGAFVAGATTTSIQFFSSSGNVTSGIFSLYGITQ